MSALISADNSWMLFAVLVMIAAVSIRLEQRYRWAAQVSACMLCLVFSMALANLRVIPTDAAAYDFVWGYIVPLSIPFLLFKADLRRIWKESGKMFGMFILSSVGTAVGGLLAFFLLKNRIGYETARSAVPMFVGTYVGGSVNLVAMAETASAGEELLSAAIVADNLLMVLYFFVLAAIPGVNWILRHYSHPLIEAGRKKKRAGGARNAADYWKAKPVALTDLSMGFAAACMIAAGSNMLADFFGNLIPGQGFVLSLVHGLLGNRYLLITAVTAVLATAFPRFFGNIAGAEEIGTFLIHIFFAVIGAPASILMIVRHAPLLLLFAGVVVFMNMVFSLGLGRLLGYSIEEIIVASNANIGGPTTSAAFAIAKGWHELVIPALLVGTLGYVIGNYYGVFLYTLI